MPESSNETTPYCYAITRRDLPFPAKAVQCGHAIIEAHRKNLIPHEIEHPHLIICELPDECSLLAFCDKLDANGIKFATFREPDRNNETTACCTEPIYGQQRSLFRKLQLLKCPDQNVLAEGSFCALKG